MTHFTNEGVSKARVSFAAPYPGKIIPVDLNSVGGRLICQKDAFLCAAKGTKVGIAFNKRIGVGFFGGEGFILQDLQGDGLVSSTPAAPSLNEPSRETPSGLTLDAWSPSSQA